MRLTLSLNIVVLLAAFVWSGCASIGGAIPVEDYKDAGTTDAEYLIATGDMLAVQVWDQPQMSGRMRVRTDGRISLPFVNDIEAAGKTPTKLAGDLEAGLKDIILTPRVTVVVEESRLPTISVLGEVAKPGTVALDGDFGVAQALAAAGGLTNFADKNKIFVVRTEPKPVRIHFTYEALTQQVGAATTFRLRPGDVVVVE